MVSDRFLEETAAVLTLAVGIEGSIDRGVTDFLETGAVVMVVVGRGVEVPLVGFTAVNDWLREAGSCRGVIDPFGDTE